MRDEKSNKQTNQPKIVKINGINQMCALLRYWNRDVHFNMCNIAHTPAKNKHTLQYFYWHESGLGFLSIMTLRCENIQKCESHHGLINMDSEVVGNYCSSIFSLWIMGTKRSHIEILGLKFYKQQIDWLQTTKHSKLRIITHFQCLYSTSTTFAEIELWLSGDWLIDWWTIRFILLVTFATNGHDWIHLGPWIFISTFYWLITYFIIHKLQCLFTHMTRS